MSSQLIIPVAATTLARRAWVQVLGLLLLGLAAIAGLVFYSFQLQRLDDALADYQPAATRYHARTEAIHRLSDMEAAFNRYLLDGNSANLGLIQSDKQRIEQLAQWDAEAQHDQLLQSLVAADQKWHSQVVQPMIEERRKLASGQGLPEDFLAKYRAAPQDLGVINLEVTTENTHHQAEQALQQSENQLRWLWLPYPLAGLLMISVIALTLRAMKSVHHLKQAAENEGDDDEEDGLEPPQNNTVTR